MGYDRNRYGTSFEKWLLAAELANLVILIQGLLIARFWLPNIDRPSKPALTLVAFLIIGFTRPTVMGWLVANFDLAPTAEWGYRQLAGLITLPTGLSITALLVNEIYQRRNAIKELSTEREELIDLQQRAESLFIEKSAEVHQIIEESIRPSINEINQVLSRDDDISAEVTEQTTALISNLIDQQLRPLSDALHEPAALSILPTEGLVKRRAFVKFNTRVPVRELFSPGLVYFLVSASAVSATIYYVGIESIFYGFSFYLPFVVIAAITKQVLPANWKLSLYLALPISAVAHLLAATPSAILVLKLTEEHAEMRRQFPVAVVAFAISALVIAFAKGVQAERKAFELEYKQANDDAASVLTNLNQRIWLSRKNAAQILHGSVQAALTAANMRLRQGKLNRSELIKVREDINRALDSLSVTEINELDLEDSIEDLIDLWDGVCLIDVAISPECLDAINRNQVAANCVNEFLKECVNNAIKHGSAKSVEVEISLQEPNRVVVEVRNDGSAKTENQSGLGTRILSEITLDWQRIVTDEETVVIGVIGLTQ